MFCSTVDRRASIVPSKNFPTELFEGENFINEACEIKARLLLNFLKQVLKKVQNKRKINILLIDKEAKAVAAAAELISLCNVFVATDRFELYGPCAEYCFLKYGDRPKKADKLSSISVAFAPFGTNGLILPNSATPVLSPKFFEGFTLSEKDFCFFHTDLFPEKVSKELGDEGRILLRESGTEPVIRVMVEAKTDELCEKYVDEVVNVLYSKGHGISK